MNCTFTTTITPSFLLKVWVHLTNCGKLYTFCIVNTLRTAAHHEYKLKSVLVSGWLTPAKFKESVFVCNNADDDDDRQKAIMSLVNVQ